MATRKKKRVYEKVGKTIPGLRLGSKLYYGSSMISVIRPFHFRSLLPTKWWVLYKIVGSTPKMWKLEEVLVDGVSATRTWEKNPKPFKRNIFKTLACTTQTDKFNPMRDWFYTPEEYQLHRCKGEIISFVQGDNVSSEAIHDLDFLVEKLRYEQSAEKQSNEEASA